MKWWKSLWLQVWNRQQMFHCTCICWWKNQQLLALSTELSEAADILQLISLLIVSTQRTNSFDVYLVAFLWQCRRACDCLWFLRGVGSEQAVVTEFVSMDCYDIGTRRWFIHSQHNICNSFITINLWNNKTTINPLLTMQYFTYIKCLLQYIQIGVKSRS